MQERSWKELVCYSLQLLFFYQYLFNINFFRRPTSRPDKKLSVQSPNNKRSLKQIFWSRNPIRPKAISDDVAKKKNKQTRKWVVRLELE